MAQSRMYIIEKKNKIKILNFKQRNVKPFH